MHEVRGEALVQRVVVIGESHPVVAATAVPGLGLLEVGDGIGHPRPTRPAC